MTVDLDDCFAFGAQSAATESKSLRIVRIGQEGQLTSASPANGHRRVRFPTLFGRYFFSKSGRSAS